MEPPVLWTEPQAHTASDQSGLAWQGSGSVDSTRPSTGSAAWSLQAHGVQWLGAGGPAVFGYWQSQSLSPCFIPGAWLHPWGKPDRLAPWLAGVFLQNRNSFSEPGFVQQPPHPRQADRARMGSERPSPSAQPAGPQGREPSPAPTGVTAVRAGQEGPESSGQPRQVGPSPHHW